MKKVLILTYYWPPAGGPGVQRWLKFVKNLPALGWEPHVLTVRNGTYSATDEQLTAEVPGNVHVYKTKSRDPFRLYTLLKGKKDRSVPVALINIDRKRSAVDRIAMYIRSNFFIPDARKGWIPFAVKEALRIIREEQIDLLVSTGPPHSTHLAGLRIKKECGITWLADLRDPWTSVYYNDMLPRTARTRRIDKGYEDRVLMHADAVTVVSRGMKEEFADRNPHVEVVMNGFDPDDMPPAVQDIPADKFRLTYTGNFKPNQHVPVLWDALIELLEEDTAFATDFILHFVGNVDDRVAEYFNVHGMRHHLQLTGYVPHSLATAALTDSALLLFVVPSSRNNKLIITGKLFEYLASGRPILSVGPTGGDAAAVLGDTGRDGMIDYNDKENMKQCLLRHYHEWKQRGGKPARLENSRLEKYSRQASAHKMAGIMHELIHSKNV